MFSDLARDGEIAVRQAFAAASRALTLNGYWRYFLSLQQGFKLAFPFEDSRSKEKLVWDAMARAAKNPREKSDRPRRSAVRSRV